MKGLNFLGTKLLKAQISWGPNFPGTQFLREFKKSGALMRSGTISAIAEFWPATHDLWIIKTWNFRAVMSLVKTWKKIFRYMAHGQRKINSKQLFTFSTFSNEYEIMSGLLDDDEMVVKGQLISKGLVGILNSSKKQTKKSDLQQSDLLYYDTSSRLVFVCF